MSIEISPETEILLAEEAKKQGVSVDALVKRLINGNAVKSPPNGQASELPKWHLGVMGELHRRDIYDDVNRASRSVRFLQRQVRRMEMRDLPAATSLRDDKHSASKNITVRAKMKRHDGDCGCRKIDAKVLGFDVGEWRTVYASLGRSLAHQIKLALP